MSMAFKILKYVDSKRSSALGALRKRRRPSRWILCGAMLVCGTAAGETPGVLCQLSKTWLQYCVGTLRGDYSAQDLAQFQA